jgi:serine protease
MPQVVSMSIGGPGDPLNSTGDYLSSKYQQGDVLFMAASGNSGSSELFYPAGYDAVLSVTATDARNRHASFSQSNADVELAAPGVRPAAALPSTVPPPALATPLATATATAPWPRPHGSRLQPLLLPLAA